jgi:uncharacterized membrane protein YoaK (UPF0700 family)
MLFRGGVFRSDRVDRRVACSLAAIAGALNTAGFSIVGLYSSNMTGNVSALANSLAVRDFANAATYLALVTIFIAGAAVSTFLINVGRQRRFPAAYALNLVIEAALLTGLGYADLWLPDVMRGPLLAFGLSFLLGLQNALVTRISNARIRTTHVTGMVTDIGIELGNIAASRGKAFNQRRLRLHAQTVGSFLAGGLIGVWGYSVGGAYFFFTVALLLLLLATPAILGRLRPGARW